MRQATDNEHTCFTEGPTYPFPGDKRVLVSKQITVKVKEKEIPAVLVVATGDYLESDHIIAVPVIDIQHSDLYQASEDDSFAICCRNYFPGFTKQQTIRIAEILEKIPNINKEILIQMGFEFIDD